MGLLRERNFQIIIASVVLADLGGSEVGAILPAMIEPLNATEQNIGLLLSVFTLCAMLTTPFVGLISDYIGRLKILIPSLFIFGTIGALIPICSSFNAVLFLRGIQGIAVGGIMNTGHTLIGDFYKDNKRARAMGYRMSFQTFSNAIVPFIAGGLATIAWFYPFFIYTLAIPVAIIALVSLKEPKKKKSGLNLSKYIKGAGFILKQDYALWIYFSTFMTFVLLYAAINYIPILITRSHGLTTMHAGLAISLASIIASLTSAISGKLMQAYSTPSLVFFAFTSFGLSHLLIYFGGSFPLIILFLSIGGIGFGLLMPILNTEAAGLAPTKLRAGVLSIFTMLIYLGQTVAPPLFGFILGIFNINSVFAVASLITLLPLVFTSLIWWFRITQPSVNN